MEIFLTSIESNRQKLDGGAMFGNAPKALWSKWHTPDELGRIELACRCLLIETKTEKILCETGIGSYMNPEMSSRFGVQNPSKHMLLENLNKLGISEKDITHVMLSHLHFDHSGGLLSSYKDEETQPTLLFPNAKIIVGRKALDRAITPHPRDRASFIPFLPNLLQNSGRLHVIEDSNHSPKNLFGSLQDRISFITTDGHTPSQLHLVLQGNKQKVLFCGDMIPGTSWLSTAITMGYDRFAEKVVDEKEELCKAAVKESWMLFYTHDPKVAASSCQLSPKGKYEPTLPIEVLTKYAF